MTTSKKVISLDDDNENWVPEYRRQKQAEEDEANAGTKEDDGDRGHLKRKRNA